MANKKKLVSGQELSEKFVIYKPDQLSYQKLHLCNYLRELPEINPDEAGNSGSAHQGNKENRVTASIG
jgi:hypothetical protein